MRKFIALIAIVGFSAQAYADGHMTNSGSFRLQYTNTANTDYDDSTGADAHVKSWQQRTRLNTDVKVSDAMSAHVGLVHNAQWGNIGPSEVATADGGDDLLVNEAYGAWNINDEWMARFGRGGFTLADGSVISSNDYEAVSTAFDGVMATYDHEVAKLTLFGVEGVSATPATNESAEFWGVSADFKSLPSFLKSANLHYMMVKSNITGSEEDSARLGFTVKGDTANVDYRATYATYTGEEAAPATDIDASMMDAEVGYSMPGMMNLRISAGYHTDSGDDAGADNKRYSGFYYDRHNNAGLMDVVGWGNLTYTRLGFTLDPRENTTVGFDMYTFTATEENDVVNATDGTTAVASVAAQDDVGSEMDIYVTHRYSSNFAITARYGTFAPGDKIGPDGDDMTVTYVEANMTF